MKTTSVQAWLHHPQRLWLRRAIFQVHLWSGILLGLYVVIVCVSGSAVVFRTDLENHFSNKMQVPVSGPPLTREQLQQSIERAYPGYAIRTLTPGRFASEATQVVLVRGWWEKQRVFNPYTGKDIGPSADTLFRCLRWLGDVHGNLLMGQQGLTANGVGGFLTALICLTGIVVWWPGSATWRRGLWARGGVGWKRFNWDLHSATGFWIFAIMLMWGLTGAYFIFPEPFRAVINIFTTIDPPRVQQMGRPPSPFTLQPVNPLTAGTNTAPAIPRRRGRRPRTRGQKILLGFSAAHYGNFGGWPLKVLWVILGLAPAVLFVTGILMWWNRVLSPAARRFLRRTDRAPAELATTQLDS
jgi:uncharacterized iron-regulated membrane protein